MYSLVPSLSRLLLLILLARLLTAHPVDPMSLTHRWNCSSNIVENPDRSVHSIHQGAEQEVIHPVQMVPVGPVRMTMSTLMSHLPGAVTKCRRVHCRHFLPVRTCWRLPECTMIADPDVVGTDIYNQHCILLHLHRRK